MLPSLRTVPVQVTDNQEDIRHFLIDRSAPPSLQPRDLPPPPTDRPPPPTWSAPAPNNHNTARIQDIRRYFKPVNDSDANSDKT